MWLATYMLMFESLLVVGHFSLFFLISGAVTLYNGKNVLCFMALSLKNLVWTTYYPAFHRTLDRFFFQYLTVSLTVSVVPPMLHTHSFIYHQCYINLTVDMSKK